MSDNEIKPGDVVYLKGDKDIKLTVEYVFNNAIKSNLAVKSAKCAWFYQGEKREATFSIEALVKAS